MWQDCRGNVTVAVVGATAACMIIALIFISMTGIYAANQTADTAASAAAMGALRSLRGPMLVEAESETNHRLQLFWQEVGAAVSDRVDDWEDSYRSSRQAVLEAQVPPLTPEEIEAIIDEEVADRRPGKAKAYRTAEVTQRKPVIASELLSGVALPLDVRVREFLRPDDRGCLIYQVARANEGTMESAAQGFAGGNSSELESVEFRTGSRLEVESKVRIRIRLALYDALLPAERRHLTMTGSAYLDNLVGQSISFPAGCRKG